MDLGLQGAAAVVSGGSKGMGRAAAECLAGEGARVAVLARGRPALDDTVEALARAGSPDAVGITTDLTVRADVDAAFAQLSGRWGVGALGRVQRVGQPQPGRSRSGFAGSKTSTTRNGTRPSTSARSVPLGVCAPRFPLLRAADWARIVNVSAHSTKRQSAELVAYAASKAALTSFSKNLSLSLAPDGILVNTVSPGSFLSPGMRAYLRALPPERGVGMCAVPKPTGDRPSPTRRTRGRGSR